MTTTSHRAALERARQQLALIADAEREHLAANPYRLTHEHDVRGGRYVVRVHVMSPPPPEITTLTSSAVQSLRDSLDALTTSLAGAPTRFPIYESLAQFAQRARKAIAPMTDDAQAFLEDLQPYHAIGGFRNGPLWILRELAAEDALRLAPSITSGSIGVNTQRDVSLLGEPIVATGPFVDGAVVASVPTKIAGRDPKLDMFLRAEFALALPSQGPARGRAVVALLGELCDHVERVVFGALEPTLAARG